MRAHTKIKIDRLIGGPLCWLLNLLARCAGTVLRRDHRIPPADVQVICVAKYAGMGSILSALPLVIALKDRYPHAKLVFISSSKNAALLERVTTIDERLYVAEDSLKAVALSTLALCLRLWCLHPALYIDLELYSYYASLVAVLSGAKNRLGFYRQSTAFKRGLFTHLVFFNTAVPVHELYLQLGYVADCSTPEPVAENNGKRQLCIQQRDRDEVQAVLNNWGKHPAPLLVVNPNASDLCLERRWPLERFVAVITALLDKLPALSVALTGAPAEHAYVARLHTLLASYEHRVANLAGKLSLGSLLALLERADCVLTNDSGPMHMAFTLSRPTVALFGPVHPKHYTMLADCTRTIIFYEPVVCSPCLHHSDVPPCGGDNQCMKLIRTDGVIATCLAFLSPESRLPQRLPQQWLPLGPESSVKQVDGQPLGRVLLRPTAF
jgi:ADP-heptose:LPS heptosyltransferase